MNFFKVHQVVFSYNFSDRVLILATTLLNVRRGDLKVYGFLASKMLHSAKTCDQEQLDRP